MRNISIGVDNGLHGAVAVLEGNKEPILFDTPITKIKVAGKIRETFIVEKMARFLEQYGFRGWLYKSSFALIEETIAMPRQSSQSGLTTGYGEGLWKGILTTHKINWEEVSIRDWQSYFGIYGRGKYTKKVAYGIASTLFPRVRLKTKRGRILDGRCDALLIAEYNRRTRK